MPEPKVRRVLLDENIDRMICPLFDADFEVRTVQEQGWAGLQNGALLRAAAETFDVFVTMDQQLPYQQNLRVLDLAVVIVRSVSNAFTVIAPLMPLVNEAVRTAQPGAPSIVAR